MTRLFQVLSKVHFILSDKEKRAFYDTTGLVDKEDCLDSQADWDEYFRALFPKVTTNDIDAFFVKYIGSQEELDDVKKYYLKFEGDMDKMCEFLFSFDELRTPELVQQLVNSGEVPSFDSFTKEPEKKRKRRQKRGQKEDKSASKVSCPTQNLLKAIQSRSKSNFDSIISSLEAKYSQPSGKRQKRNK